MHKIKIKCTRKSLIRDFTEMFHFSPQTAMLNVRQKKHAKGHNQCHLENLERSLRSRALLQIFLTVRCINISN